MAPFDKLFYEKEKSGQTYTTTQVGAPVLSRLAEGKSDYWLKPSRPKVREKKTLVLTDWRAECWSEAEKAIKIEKLRELLVEHNFNILVNINGALKELNEKMLKRFESDEFLKSIFPATKRHVIEQSGIPKDELFLLDSDAFDDLVYSKGSEEVIRERDLGGIHNKDKTDKIVETYKERNTPPIIEIESFNSPKDYGLSQFKKCFRDIEIDIDPNAFKLDFADLRRLISEGQIESEKIQLTNTKHLKYIFHIDGEIEEEVEEKDYLNVLGKVTYLQSLYLSETCFIEGTERLNPCHLNDLYDLKLANGEYRLGFLSSLLANSQSLTSLLIHRCRITSNEMDEESAINFPSLKSLILLDCDITQVSIETLEKILSSSHSIEDLYFKNSPMLFEAFSMSNKIDYSSIKTLSLDLFNTSPETLLAFLSKCSNLKTIKIRGGNFEASLLDKIAKCQPNLLEIGLEDIILRKDKSPPQDTETHFLSLKSLKLTNTSIDINALDRVLTKAKTLTDITILSTALTGKKERKTPSFELTQLKHLSVISSGANTDTLNAILKGAKSIESFDCYQVNDIEEEDEFNYFDLNETLRHLSITKLQNVELSHKSINSNTLSFFEKAKELIDIDIKWSYRKAQVESTSELTSKDPLFELPGLENITFSNLNTSLPVIQSMLQQATHLQKMEFRHCSFHPELTVDATSRLDKAVLLDKDTLPKFDHLENCNFYDTDFTMQDIIDLLKISGSMKTLSITDCSMLRHSNEVEGIIGICQIRKLALNEKMIHPLNLKQFLMLSPVLEQLNINELGLTPEIEEIHFTDLPLQNLKKISVEGTNIPLVKLQEIINNQPDSLEVQYFCKSKMYTGIADYISLLEGSPQVSNINIARQTITKKELNTLLKSSRFIKTIDFSNLTLTDTDDPLDTDFELTALTRLDISSANISLEILKAILRKSPNLIECSFYRDQAREFDAELISLLPAGTKLPETKARRSLPQTSHQRMEGLLDGSKTPSSSPLQRRAPIKMQASRLDADTALEEDKQFNVTQHFFTVGESKAPPVNYERLSIFSKLKMNSKACDIAYAFQLDPPVLNLSGLPIIDLGQIPHDESMLEAGEIIRAHNHEAMVVGCHELPASKEWQALPSCWVNEKLYLCKLSQDEQLEFVYSKERSQFFVRRVEPNLTPIKIEYLLGKKQTKDPAIPEDIQSIIKECQAFKMDSLKLTPEMKGKDYIQALIEQKVGACRHRAAVFKYRLSQTHPHIPVRVIDNECHSFIEIQLEGVWQSICLGGYPAKLEIDNSQDPLSNETPLHKEHAELTSRGVIASSENYRAQFKTWERKKDTIHHPASFFRHLIQHSEARTLLNVSQSSTLSFEINLLQFAKEHNRPIFIINSPEDLVCSMPHIISEDGIKGKVQWGQGGKLHDFLKSNQDTNPIIMVNYNHFTAAEIVRCNQLLDTEPKADGTPLPEGSSVIGLMDTTLPDAYSGSDFYSRFNKVIQNPIAEDKLSKSIPLSEKKDSLAVYSINLFHGSDWYERLMGRWTINNQELIFEEGELAKAIKSKLPINIINANWSDPKFVLFFEQLRLNDGEKGLIFPPTTRFYTQDGYQFKEAVQQLSFSLCEAAAPPFLNPSSLSSFILSYELREGEQGLFPIDGLLAQHKKSTPLSLTLSRALTEDEWARLFDEAKKHDIFLDIKILPGIIVPDSIIDALEGREEEHQLLDAQKEVSDTVPFMPDREFQANSIIQSTDIDLTVTQLLAQGGEQIVIDISSSNSADLIGAIGGSLNESEGRFEFEYKKGVLVDLLEQGKKIILKGDINEELLDSLAPYLLSDPKIQLIASPSSLLKGYHAPIHTVRTTEKEDALVSVLPTSESAPLRSLSALIADTPYIRLKTMLTFKEHHPDSLHEAPWIGMDSLPKKTKLASFDIKTSTKEAEAFKRERIKAVTDTLEHAPFVVLTGATGVGKSTFIHKHLKSSDNILYTGERNISLWASDESQKRKLLFIDEANITDNDWLCFEGLYHNPPYLILDGKLKKLDEHHKVVFAMNPQSYGDERQTPKLFERHGNAVLFRPMPLSYLYEEVLSPLFHGSAASAHQVSISEELLNAYQFMCEHSEDKILISPRELKMISMLVIAEMNKHPELYTSQSDIKKLTDHYINMILLESVPASQKSIFKARYPLNTSLIEASRIKYEDVCESQQHDYILTESRHAINHALDSFLSLRSFRQDNRTSLNKTQLKGGLGAFVIEGEPGIGKSEFVKYKLQEFGVIDQKTDLTGDAPNVFYHISVSMQSSEKERLLLEAFDRGAIVIMDEINSSPSMERLLNTLLMGETPDGEPATNPGFIVIGTQNPVTMSGRKAVSQALKRRSFSVDLPAYSKEEMQHILVDQMGLDNDIAEHLIDAFLIQKQKATLEHLSPPPCFRDLLNVAKEYKTPPFQTALSDEIPEQEHGRDISTLSETEHQLTHPIISDGVEEDDLTPPDVASSYWGLGAVRSFVSATFNLLPTSFFGHTQEEDLEQKQDTKPGKDSLP